MLKVGDKIPAGSLPEFIEVEGNGCTLGPNTFDVREASAGKTIAIFALPGAYTPTCSAQHVPGFVKHAGDFKAAGVDEIWCVSVNDAFVMGAWGRDQKTGGKVRMMADGSGTFTAAAGLTLAPALLSLGHRRVPPADRGALGRPARSPGPPRRVRHARWQQPAPRGRPLGLAGVGLPRFLGARPRLGRLQSRPAARPADLLTRQ